MISHQVRIFHEIEREKIFLVIESAIEQRDLFKRYCDGEDVFNEGANNNIQTPFVLLKESIVLFY